MARRQPKPRPTWAVAGVIRLVPVIGAQSQEEMVRAAAEFLEWADPFSALLGMDRGHVDDLTESVLKRPDQVALIDGARVRLADAIRIALHQTRPTGASRDTQAWLQDAIDLSPRRVVWTHRGATRVHLETDPRLAKSPGLQFASVAAVCVCEAFTTAPGLRSVVEHYVGACRQCGAIFLRTSQANRLYCSDACRQAAYRERKAVAGC